MIRLRLLLPWAALLLACLVLPRPALAQYAARRSGDAVQLEDRAAQIVVSIVPSVGNVAFEMKVKGVNVLWFPYASVEDFRAKPRLSGIPFLGPWANRLDEQAFYANGRRYAFDMELGNVRGPRPSHGFLSSASQWQVIEVKADDKAAWVTSRLEFSRQPAWMAQFPFAHTIEMTYRLSDGALEVATSLENLSAEPMPVSIGFHPYFQVTDAPRDEWVVSIGARTAWVLSPDKIPTGETRPIETVLPNPRTAPLRDLDLDHVFGDLIREPSGRAVMSVKGKSQRVDVLYGPNYRAAVVYAPLPAAAPPPASTASPSPPTTAPSPATATSPSPAPSTSTTAAPPPDRRPDRNFVCFEPMAGITNALNLAHRGLYQDLQHIPPGQTWRESFWIRPSGF